MGRLFFNTLGFGVLLPPDDENDPDPKRKKLLEVPNCLPFPK
jgi:hypothetical protein